MKEAMVKAGFTENEAEVYMAFLEIGEGSIEDCAKATGIPRATTYRTIKDILKRGLIVEIYGKPLRYYPVNPRDVFNNIRKEQLEEIEERKRQIPQVIDQIIEEAEKLYEAELKESNNGRDIMMLHGKEAIRREGGSMLIYESRKTLYREPLYFPSTLEVQYEWVKEYADLGIVIQLLLETEMLNEPHIAKKALMYLELGHPVRHIHSFPGKMDIFDNKSALLAVKYNEVSEKLLAVLVNNKDMVELLTRAFDSLWDEAAPVTIEYLRERELL